MAIETMQKNDILVYLHAGSKYEIEANYIITSLHAWLLACMGVSNVVNNICIKYIFFLFVHAWAETI